MLTALNLLQQFAVTNFDSKFDMESGMLRVFANFHGCNRLPGLDFVCRVEHFLYIAAPATGIIPDTGEISASFPNDS